jgi:hypothetical protein
LSIEIPSYYVGADAKIKEMVSHAGIKAAALLLIALVTAQVQCVALCAIGICPQGRASQPAACHQSHGNPPAHGDSRTQNCAPPQPFFGKSSAESFPDPDAQCLGVIDPVSHAFPDRAAVNSTAAAEASPPLRAGPFSILVLRV